MQELEWKELIDGESEINAEDINKLAEYAKALNKNKPDKDDVAIDVDNELDSDSINPVQNKVIATALANKVDKVSGKGLSSNDFTDEQRVKLEHINIITDSESSNHYQDTERILGFLKAGNYSNGLNIICTGDYSYEYGLLIVSPSDYKETVYIDPFGYIFRFESETFSDEDWVLIGNPYATTTYIDNAIGDVETSLENIIKKYGLGGDGV